MRAKRFTVEQIVAKLREAEKLQGQGLTIPQICKRLQISASSHDSFLGDLLRPNLSLARTR